MPDSAQLWNFLIQIPITAVVIWVTLRLLSRESEERKAFMAAMEKTDVLFTAELKAERESRERLSIRIYEALGALAAAISELRGEVRKTSNARHEDSR